MTGTKANPGTACLGETYNLTTVQNLPTPQVSRQPRHTTPLALRHTMKFQPDRSAAQTIHGSGPGWIGVAGETHTHSLIVGSGALL